MNMLKIVRWVGVAIAAMAFTPAMAFAAAKPLVGVPGPTTALLNVSVNVLASVTDQSGSGIQYCHLYVDNAEIGAMLVAGSNASMNYTFTEPGVHTMFVFCKDNMNGMESGDNASVLVTVPSGVVYTPVVQAPGFTPTAPDSGSTSPSSPPSSSPSSPTSNPPTTVVVNSNPGLIKLACPLRPSADTLCHAVYYHGADGKRHPFPNQRIYSTWYGDFSGVREVTADAMAAITLGKPALYRPGLRLVKFTTLPKVYAVGARGQLRWIRTEALARALYGDTWNKIIDDMADTMVTDYTFGADITSANEFSPSAQSQAVTTIDNNQM